MLIFKELSYKPKEEIERVKNSIALTDDEQIMFDMLIYERATYQQVADELYKSIRTINRMAQTLHDKIIILYTTR